MFTGKVKWLMLIKSQIKKTMITERMSDDHGSSNCIFKSSSRLFRPKADYLQ